MAGSRRAARSSISRILSGLSAALVVAASAEAAGSSFHGPDPPQPTTGPDVGVNDPSLDALALPNCRTQNEVSLARWGRYAVAAWNDVTQRELMVARLAGDFVPGINFGGYAWSDDGGREWKDRDNMPLPPGESGGRGLFGDPVVAVSGDGVFYYASRAVDEQNRSIIAVARSDDHGWSFTPPVNAAAGRPDGVGADKPWIAVDDTPTSPFYGNVYVAWTEEAPAATPGFPTHKVILSRSIDGGRTFQTPLQLRHQLFAIGTQIAVGPAGEVYVAFLGSPYGLLLARSLDGGASFHNPRTGTNESYLEIRWTWPLGHVTEACVGIEGVDQRPYVLNGDIRVLAWPSLAADTSGSPDPLSPDHNPFWGRLYIALATNPNVGSESDDEADAFLLWSSDRGEDWTPISSDSGKVLRLDTSRSVNDDAGTNDQFHAQVAVDDDGRVAMAWYDRRLSSDSLRANWEIDMFAAVSTDGGVSFGPNVRVSDRSFSPGMTHPNTNLMTGCYMGEYNGLAADDDGFIVAWGDNRDFVAGLPDPNVYSDRLVVESQGFPLNGPVQGSSEGRACHSPGGGPSRSSPAPAPPPHRC